MVKQIHVSLGPILIGSVWAPVLEYVHYYTGPSSALYEVGGDLLPRCNGILKNFSQRIVYKSLQTQKLYDLLALA